MKALTTKELQVPAAYRAIVRTLLSQHLPHAEVWAYGSRVTGTGHTASDLDLVVRNPAQLDKETGAWARS